MALTTRFTELLGIPHPIVLAPMGGSAGGALAAAVSRGGGLGMLGAADGDRAWLDREVPIVAAGTDRPWGIGFLTWMLDADAVRRALEHRPRAVMLSFGDPAPYAELVRRSGAVLIVQVTDLEEARRAVDVGADVIVAQGTEAGGHGARRGRSTLPFVPVVVDLADPVPVLAAGGIADGRGVAAALALGAAGAVIGTRFQATREALVDPAIAGAIVGGRAEDTERSAVLDIARGSSWPSRYTARTLGHPYLDRWRGREQELAADARARQDYQDDVARGAIPPLPVWAGESVDLITDLPSAADLVPALVERAEQALTAAHGRPRTMRVRTADGTHEWALRRTDADDLLLRAPDGRQWAAAGEDLHESLLALRRALEADGILLCCNGARRNVHGLGMSRSMSGGEVAYALRRWRRSDVRDLVEVLDPADCKDVVTIDEQQAWYDAWQRTVTGWHYLFGAPLDALRRR
ncbi:nitronate monooxygenase [Dactylosporangium sp. NBC_01737]|uniref:NAD(P)H-dependent flavin oxidoreductase n=1 Tax=Dactylosporangium sp. NBC_01737 TaxID=2975959 RepID=UPI002E0DA03F|nr:nitronate monooxygenase [Dactylosporangium sp. NBC_01737]